MRFKYVEVTRNSECPWCGTEVPRGVGVCAGCGAVHCVRRRAGRVFLPCFAAGLLGAVAASSGNALTVAFSVALAGTLLMRFFDEATPQWVR